MSDPVAVLALVDTAAALVACPDNRFVACGWDDAAAALAELDEVGDRLRGGVVPSSTIARWFRPTGPLQQLSLDSGWGDAFVALAALADAVLAACADRPYTAAPCRDRSAT